MYAVIETGGKQYRVERGDVLDVETQARPEGKSDKVRFDRVLMVAGEGGVKMGAPLLSGAAVDAVVVREVRGPKVLIFKKKKRKGYQRNAGHRQNYLRVRIQDISL